MQGFVAEVKRAGIVAHEHEKTHSHGGVSLVEQFVVARDQFLRREPVALRFGHFAAIDGQHVSVHPVIHGTPAPRGAHILGDFALVVGKLEVHATPVNVEFLAKIFGAHHRAFKVPSRKALPPRRRPLHQVARVCGLPKGKVQRVALFALAIQVTRVGQEFIDFPSGQFTVRMVLVEFADTEVHAAIDLVSVAIGHDFLDGLDLLHNVPCGGGLNGRP